MGALPSLFNSNGTGTPDQKPVIPGSTPAKAESKEIGEVKPSEVALKLTKAVESATKNWPIMKEKAVACQAAYSKIKMPTTDEEADALKKLLGKGKSTYELIVGLRKETTSDLDGIKADLMEPEKSISTLPGDKNSQYHVGVAFLNKYATEKLAKQREEEAEAQRKENETIELSRLKGVFEVIFHNNIVDYTATMETAISNYFNGLQLEKVDPKDETKVITWEDQIKKFSMKPALKKEVFESWFNQPYDPKMLTKEVYDEFVGGVKEAFTYDIINQYYIDEAQPKVDSWKAKLPDKKKELEELAALKLKDAEAAKKLEEKQKKEAEKQTQAISVTAEASKAEKSKEVEHQQRNESLGAKFETLKVTQNQEDLGGAIKRVPIVNCDPADIATVFAKALYICFTTEGFEGYLKTDKEGAPLPADENGVPQYQDWAKKILNFVADKTNVQIDGIQFKEIVKVSNRTKKEK